MFSKYIQYSIYKKQQPNCMMSVIAEKQPTLYFHQILQYATTGFAHVNTSTSIGNGNSTGANAVCAACTQAYQLAFASQPCFQLHQQCDCCQ